MSGVLDSRTERYLPIRGRLWSSPPSDAVDRPLDTGPIRRYRALLRATRALIQLMSYSPPDSCPRHVQLGACSRVGHPFRRSHGQCQEAWACAPTIPPNSHDSPGMTGSSADRSAFFQHGERALLAWPGCSFGRRQWSSPSRSTHPATRAARPRARRDKTSSGWPAVPFDDCRTGCHETRRDRSRQPECVRDPRNSRGRSGRHASMRMFDLVLVPQTTAQRVPWVMPVGHR